MLQHILFLCLHSARRRDVTLLIYSIWYRIPTLPTSDRSDRRCTDIDLWDSIGNDKACCFSHAFKYEIMEFHAALAKVNDCYYGILKQSRLLRLKSHAPAMAGWHSSGCCVIAQARLGNHQACLL